MKQMYNSDSLFQLWDFLNESLNYLDDVMLRYQFSDEQMKRLNYTRNHIKNASLGIFPVAYKTVERKYKI